MQVVQTSSFLKKLLSFENKNRKKKKKPLATKCYQML